MTDKPNNPAPAESLPEGWVRTTLGAIRRDGSKGIEPSRTPERRFELYSVPSFPSGMPEIVKGKAVGSNKQTVGPDTVLVCKINPRINRIWVVGAASELDQIASTEWIPFWPVEGVCPHYLCYYLQQHAFRDHLAASASGVGGSLMRVKPTTLAGFPLLLPPVDTQRAIASRLDELFTDLDAGVAALQRARAKLKRYRASVLKAAVEGRLTAEWREARRAEAGSQTSEVGDQRSDGGGNPMTAESAVPDVAPAARPGSRLSQPEFSFSPPLARPAVPSPTSDLRSLTSRARSLTSELRPPTSESAAELLARILAERRQRWEADQLAKFAKAGKTPPQGWQAKYVEPKAPDSANLPPLPEGWCWVRMDVAGQVQLGRQRAPQHHSGPFMHPYLRVANVYEARLDLSDVMRMNFTPREFDAYSLRYGDILLNEGQSPELVGRAAMFKGEVPECCYQKTLLRFRASCGVLPDYALMVFRAYGRTLDPDQKRHLRQGFVHGWELVPATARLCIMNLYLHGINADPCPVHSGADSLASDPGERFSMVLTNPPFGKKSSISIVNEEGDLEKDEHAYERQDFWVATKNKQLNFLQHVKTLLKMHGRCAIVVPDNVLFEGGAGETVRRNLLRQFDVHTLLRLPTGLFYAQGVKANVLFFDARSAQEAPWTQRLWVYDLRTNRHFTLKTNPLKRADLDEFVACYGPANRHERVPTWTGATPEGRWRAFDYEDLAKRDKCSLDLFWLKDKSLEDSDDLPEPDVLAQEIMDDLATALEQFGTIHQRLTM